jgi:hypothetical protein
MSIQPLLVQQTEAGMSQPAPILIGLLTAWLVVPVEARGCRGVVCNLQNLKAFNGADPYHRLLKLHHPAAGGAQPGYYFVASRIVAVPWFIENNGSGSCPNSDHSSGFSSAAFYQPLRRLAQNG